jgi:hypothetical protein
MAPSAGNENGTIEREQEIPAGDPQIGVRIFLRAEPTHETHSLSRILLGLIAICSFLCSVSSAEILKIVVDDTIQPITQEYISRAIDEAQRRGDQAVLIEINTPGGLVDSTRKIIEKITSSQVPVIVYVAPSGSRAGSAGIFILGGGRYRSHGSGNQRGCGASRADWAVRAQA